MMQPEFCPHACERVEFRQTMTSWLLFVGPRVFKIKKPRRLGFMDATTPSKRYRLCQDEVLLNRQMAGDVYLGVRAIVGSPGGYVLAEDHSDTSSNAQVFAVVMRGLPRECF